MNDYSRRRLGQGQRPWTADGTHVSALPLIGKGQTKIQVGFAERTDIIEQRS